MNLISEGLTSSSMCGAFMAAAIIVHIVSAIIKYPILPAHTPLRIAHNKGEQAGALDLVR